MLRPMWHITLARPADSLASDVFSDTVSEAVVNQGNALDRGRRRCGLAAAVTKTASHCVRGFASVDQSAVACRCAHQPFRPLSKLRLDADPTLVAHALSPSRCVSMLAFVKP